MLSEFPELPHGFQDLSKDCVMVAQDLTLGVMEVFQQIDKENGNLCFFPSNAKRGTSTLSSRGSQLPIVKCINVSKNRPHRKVLGNLNKNVYDESNSTKAKKLEKMRPASEKKYPEIETFISYDPLDYERFDVPEEHRLSDRCLAGVPLFVSVNNVERFDALTSPILLAMADENMSYDSYETFSPLYEDFAIDVPLMCAF